MKRLRQQEWKREAAAALASPRVEDACAGQAQRARSSAIDAPQVEARRTNSINAGLHYFIRRRQGEGWLAGLAWRNVQAATGSTSVGGTAPKGRSGVSQFAVFVSHARANMQAGRERAAGRSRERERGQAQGRDRGRGRGTAAQPTGLV